jgi:hypothetical protein
MILSFFRKACGAHQANAGSSRIPRALAYSASSTGYDSFISLLFCPSYIHIFCRRPESYIHIWQIVRDRNRNAGNGSSSKKAFQVRIIDLLGSRTLQLRARSSLYWVLQQFIMADCVLPDMITGILDYGNRQGDTSWTMAIDRETRIPKLLLKQFPPCTTFCSRRRQGKEILRNLCPMMIDMLLCYQPRIV